ncbi:MAG TPA: DUF1501 domain-containing protein [Gemmataceae bacterium]|jgi:hypothetical protein
MSRFDLQLSRREWLRLSAAGFMGCSMSGWLGALAADTADHPQRKRSCILLWMSGGPSQLDTFDLKPGHANGGPFKAIDTNVPGIKISEHLPKIAKFMDRMAIVRSLHSKEGDHGRATFLLRTGYLPQGPIQYPSIGALVSNELGDERSELPNFVSVAPFRVLNQGAFGSGFLGPRHAPLVVGETGNGPGAQGPNAADRALRVQDLVPPKEVEKGRTDARLDLLKQAQREFLTTHPDLPALSHQNAYDRAVRLMRTSAAKAFDLDQEKAAVRDSYGRNLFGQGCLLARRLVERHVPFVEVTLNGWDTHGNNAATVRNLSGTVDAAWAALMTDLKERGLLDTTLIVWMGEFGRTPKFPRADGRDHWPNSFSAVLAGGGIKGGQAIGDTGADGASIKERPVTVQEFLATICQALGIDHQKQNLSNVGRPIRIVAPGTKAVGEALG